MNEMIERMAKAIFAATRIVQEDTWDRLFEVDRKTHRQEAIAAIAVLREPTKAITNAIVGEHVSNGNVVKTGFAENLWRAGIDAALSEEVPCDHSWEPLDSRGNLIMEGMEICALCCKVRSAPDFKMIQATFSKKLPEASWRKIT